MKGVNRTRLPRVQKPKDLLKKERHSERSEESPQNAKRFFGLRPQNDMSGAMGFFGRRFPQKDMTDKMGAIPCTLAFCRIGKF